MKTVTLPALPSPSTDPSDILKSSASITAELAQTEAAVRAKLAEAVGRRLAKAEASLQADLKAIQAHKQRITVLLRTIDAQDQTAKALAFRSQATALLPEVQKARSEAEAAQARYREVETRWAVLDQSASNADTQAMLASEAATSAQANLDRLEGRRPMVETFQASYSPPMRELSASDELALLGGG